MPHPGVGEKVNTGGHVKEELLPGLNFSPSYEGFGKLYSFVFNIFVTFLLLFLDSTNQYTGLKLFYSEIWRQGGTSNSKKFPMGLSYPILLSASRFVLQILLFSIAVIMGIYPDRRSRIYCLWFISNRVWNLTLCLD